jgi:hypothetical protein
LVNPKINTEIMMDSGRVILFGMSKYDRIKYAERPESTAPGKNKNKL